MYDLFCSTVKHRRGAVRVMQGNIGQTRSKPCSWLRELVNQSRLRENKHCTKRTAFLPYVPSSMLRALIVRGGQAIHSSQQDTQCYRLCRAAPAAFAANQSAGLYSYRVTPCGQRYLKYDSNTHPCCAALAFCSPLCGKAGTVKQVKLVCCRLLPDSVHVCAGRHMASAHKIKVEGAVCDLDGDEQTR